VFIVRAAGKRLAVDPLQLACCAVEVVASGSALTADDSTEVRGPVDEAGPVDAHVLLVAGTVTRAAVPLVLARFRELPEPRFVVSFGACANSGGPYWDSYAVVPGVDSMLPVQVYVPGCPPPPGAVGEALETLAAGLADHPPPPHLPAGAGVMA
jgi:NADH-quinone oxidoreductase subunit B